MAATEISVLSNTVMLSLEILCVILCVLMMLMNAFVLMVRSEVGQNYNDALNIFGPICVLPGIQCIISTAKTRDRNRCYRIFVMILFAAPMFALSILFETKLISEWTIYSVVLVCVLLLTTPLMKTRHQQNPKLLLCFGSLTFLLFITSFGYLMSQYSVSVEVSKCCDSWVPPEVDANSTNSTEVNSTGSRRLVDRVLDLDGVEQRRSSADAKSSLMMATLLDWSRRLAKGGKAKKVDGMASADYQKCPLLVPLAINTGQLLAMEQCWAEDYCDGRGGKVGCAEEDGAGEDGEDLLTGKVYWLSRNFNYSQAKALWFMSVFLVIVNQEVYHHLAHDFSQTRFESLSLAYIEWIILIMSLGVTTVLGVCWALDLSPNHPACSGSILLYFATVCAFRCWLYRQPEPELELEEENDGGGGDGALVAEVAERRTQAEERGVTIRGSIEIPNAQEMPIRTSSSQPLGAAIEQAIANHESIGVGEAASTAEDLAVPQAAPFDIDDISAQLVEAAALPEKTYGAFAIVSHSDRFAQTPRLPTVEASRESAAPAPGGCSWLGCGLGSCPKDRTGSREEISGPAWDAGANLAELAAGVQPTPPAADEPVPASPMAGDAENLPSGPTIIGKTALDMDSPPEQLPLQSDVANVDDGGLTDAVRAETTVLGTGSSPNREDSEMVARRSSTPMGPCSSITTHAPVEQPHASEENLAPIRVTIGFQMSHQEAQAQKEEDKTRPSSRSAAGALSGRLGDLSTRISAVKKVFVSLEDHIAVAFQHHHNLFRPLLKAGAFTLMIGTFVVAYHYKVDPMHAMMMMFPFLVFSVIFARISYSPRTAIFFTLVWVILDGVMCYMSFKDFWYTTPVFHLADFDQHVHMVATVFLILGFTAICWLIPMEKGTASDLWIMSGNFLVAVPLVVDIICKYYSQSVEIAVLCENAIDAANCIPGDETAPIVDDPLLMPVRDLRPMYNANYSSQTMAIRVAGMQLLCYLFVVLLPSYWARALDAYKRVFVFQLTKWEWLHGICTAILVFAAIFVETKNLGPYYTAFEIVAVVDVLLLVVLLLNHRYKKHLRVSQKEDTRRTSKTISLIIFVVSIVLDLAFTGFNVLSYAVAVFEETLKSCGRDWAIPPFYTMVFPMLVVRAAQMLKWHKKRCSTFLLANYCFFRVMYSFGLGQLYHAAEFTLLPQPLSITSWIAPTFIGLGCFGLLRFIMIDATVNRRNHMMRLLVATPPFATILSRVICFDHAVSMYPWDKGSYAMEVMLKMADADQTAGPARVQAFKEMHIISWQAQAQITLFINLIIWPSFWIPYTQLTVGRINIGEVRCIEKVNFVIWAMLITGCLLWLSGASSRILNGPLTMAVPVLQFLHIVCLCIVVKTHSNEKMKDRMQIFFAKYGSGTASQELQELASASSMASASASGRSTAAAMTGQESYHSEILNEDSNAHRLSLFGKDEKGDEELQDTLNSITDNVPL